MDKKRLLFLFQFPDPNVVKWDDDTNGEIYTERMSTHLADADTNVVNVVNGDAVHPLYVVENGKEYRLVTLQERRQMFEPRRKKPVSKPKQDIPVERVPEPDPEEIVPVVPEEVPAPAEEPIKCQNLPYILEEQEVLQNIHIVKNIRNMFIK